ncbi:MAG: sigma factor-like helix-turn-helix DNA-binding protein [Gammaproteobacteria bacterium]
MEGPSSADFSWCPELRFKDAGHCGFSRASGNAPEATTPSVRAEITRHCCSRNEAIQEAYATGGYSYREIAAHFGLHLSTVGQMIHIGKKRCAT